MFIPLTVAVDIKWQIFDAILCRIIGLHYLRVKIMITKVNCYIEKGDDMLSVIIYNVWC